MSFRYGFYDSLNHDREYDALDISLFFEGLITDGVFAYYKDGLLVKENTQHYDTVIISSGKAWLNHTWNYNDANMYLAMDRSELIYDRIDAVVIDIDQNELVRENKIVVIKGEPGDNPQRPELIKDDENEHWQYPLAYILRPANSDYIEQRHITSMVGTDELPFVSGIPNVKITVSDLLAKWESEFKYLYNHYKKDFLEWFESLQYILDGDVAGHLQNEFDNLSRKVAEVILIEPLPMGSTELAIENVHITDQSTIDIYCNKWGINPSDVVFENGILILKFEDPTEQEAQIKIIVRDLQSGFFTG